MKTLRSLLLAFACGAAFVSGLAFAQTIVRSVQQSQDPSGPIGFDVNNNVFFQRGVHILSTAPATPVVSACGTFTNVGTDFSGRVTISAGTPTSCTLTFSTAFGTAPNCIVAAQGAIPATTFSWATTTTTLVLTTAAANTVWDYICVSTL
jgi:hypothetical protein